MKTVLLAITIFTGTKLFAQTKDEDQIIAMSKNLFQWEMRSNADSIAAILDDGFIGVSSAGIRRNKTEYLANIKNPATIHNSMDIQETKVNIFGNTAILTGNGYFVITANNVQSTFHLFYMETYMKTSQGWKLIALHGSRFPD